MFVLGHFINALALVIYYVLNFFVWIIVARAVLSWVSPDPFNPIVRFIYNVTEPLMSRIRKWLPISYRGIDFSPVIIILTAVFLQEFVVGSLRRLAVMLIR